MTKVTASNVRENFSEIVNRATYAGERVVIHRRGKELAAIVPIADLRLIEKMEDEIDAREAGKSLSEMKRGKRKPVPWVKAKKELEL